MLSQQGLVTLDTGNILEMSLLCYIYGAHFLPDITCAFSKRYLEES